MATVAFRVHKADVVCRLLTHYNVQLQYVSPDGLGMPQHILDYVASRGVSQQQFDVLDKVLPDTDVLYMTRIQKERFSSEPEYNKVYLTNSLRAYHCDAI